MDSRGHDSLPQMQAVLAEATCIWADADERTNAVIVHAARDILVLEATDTSRTLPPLGTEVRVRSDSGDQTGRLAEHGRGGRFLVALGSRPVRGGLRLRVSLPGTLRSRLLAEPRAVEIVDLTTAGCRVRGVELAIDDQVSLDFTPPGRDLPVTVRAQVAHGSRDADQPWIGLRFRLVALRGGR